MVVNGLQVSESCNILSRVPHGSVFLRQLLFVLYIDYIDDSDIKDSKFADDTKMCKKVNAVDDSLWKV